MPTITSRRPRFGRWAPILTCILWSVILLGWIFFLHSASAHLRSSPPDNQDYYGTANIALGFFGMILGTIVLFVAGLIILAAAAITYNVRSRQYRLEQEALAASQPVTPPLL